MPHHNRARLADISEKKLDPTKNYVTDKSGKLALPNQTVVLKTKKENILSISNSEVEIDADADADADADEKKAKVLESNILLEENIHFKAVNNKKPLQKQKQKQTKAKTKINQS